MALAPPRRSGNGVPSPARTEHEGLKARTQQQNCWLHSLNLLHKQWAVPGGRAELRDTDGTPAKDASSQTNKNLIFITAREENKPLLDQDNPMKLGPVQTKIHLYMPKLLLGGGGIGEVRYPFALETLIILKPVRGRVNNHF